MLKLAARPSQAVTRRVEVLAAVSHLPRSSLGLLVRVSDDLGETQWRVIEFGHAEIAEGGGAGVEREKGVLEGAAGGALGIRSVE